MINLMTTLSRTFDWQARLAQLQAELATLQTQLVDAETMLAETLSAIHAFEFHMRRRIEPFIRKLETIEAEVKQFFKRLQIERQEAGEDDFVWNGRFSDEPTDRYHAHTEDAPHELNADQKAELKKLYRQLARRFHPDMGITAEDRAYRTQIMMAINSAYALGDLEKLQALADEPDLAIDAVTNTDEEQVKRLERELQRVKRRLQEVALELKKIETHRSRKLMRQAERAEVEGRDFFAQMIRNIQDRIAQKEAELEWLKSEGELMMEDLDVDDLYIDDEEEWLSQFHHKQTRGEWRSQFDDEEEF